MKSYGENDDFSSPEVDNNSRYYQGRRGGHGQIISQTDADPSSSSMSGYDLKGMLNRVQNQANQYQNNNNMLANNEYQGEEDVVNMKHQRSDFGMQNERNFS